MNCADAENLICDYATLSSAERSELERHLGECPACAELARDATAGAAFLRRAVPVEPPPELINRILFQVPRSGRFGNRQKSKFGVWMEALLSPILQPRYAMGLAMTIVSFAMLAQFVAPIRKIRPEDLKPAAVWAGLEDRAYRTWGRAVKFYDNLKVVYQIQNTLADWQQRDEEQAPGSPAAPSRSIDEKKLPIRSLPDQTPENPAK
jgi:hypothetical protein